MVDDGWMDGWMDGWALIEVVQFMCLKKIYEKDEREWLWVEAVSGRPAGGGSIFNTNMILSNSDRDFCRFLVILILILLLVFLQIILV